MLLALASIGISLVNYLVWAVGAGIVLWIVLDAIRVSRSYPEEFLVSSVEGEAEQPPPCEGHGEKS